MDFIQVTLSESKQKYAIRKSDIGHFRESFIIVDDKQERCIDIVMKNDDWIKVSETFDDLFHVVNHPERDIL